MLSPKTLMTAFTWFARRPLRKFRPLWPSSLQGPMIGSIANRRLGSFLIRP